MRLAMTLNSSASWLMTTAGAPVEPPVDTTAPILTLPLAAADGESAATGSVYSNERTGALFWVVSLLAILPDQDQMEAGEDSTGSAALAANSQPVTSAGEQVLSPAPSGLPADTDIYLYFMHRDAAGNRSAVVGASPIRTAAPADVTAPLLTDIMAAANGQTAATGSVTSNEDNGLVSWVVCGGAAPDGDQVEAGEDSTGAAAAYASAQAVTAAGVQVLSPAPSGLAPGTPYRLHVVHRDAAGNRSAVLSSSVFTTEAEVAGDVTTTFGALTLAGAGGVPVTGTSIASGDPDGDWAIASGRIAPSETGEGAISGTYSLTLDDGQTVGITVVSGVAHCRGDELAATYAAIPTTAAGIKIRPGNYVPIGRITLSARAWTDLTIEGDSWTLGWIPKASFFTTFMPAITLAAGAQNITIKGLDLYGDRDAGGLEAFDGVIAVEKPSNNITITNNRIHSKDLETLWFAGDGALSLSGSNIVRGIVANGTAAQPHTDLSIIGNHIHNTSRGMWITAAVASALGRCPITGNWIEDVYNNFTTIGGEGDGILLADNVCQHVWASSDDGSPHAAAGGSFDAPDAGASLRNVDVFGNIFAVGWHRTRLARDNGKPDPGLAATGMKFNDPKTAESYQNVEVGYNLVVSHGICLQVSGCDGVNIRFNALVPESYTGLTDLTSLYLGAQNAKIWGNMANSYIIPDTNGTIVSSASTPEFLLPDARATYAGYGNLPINTASPLGPEDLFVGHPTKGLDELETEELADAYALSLPLAIGPSAPGYSGAGVLTSAAEFDPPTASGTASDAGQTVFDGSTYLTGGVLQQGGSNVTDGTGLLFALDIEIDPVDDGQQVYWFTSSGEGIALWKTGKTRMQYTGLTSGSVSTAYSIVGDTSGATAEIDENDILGSGYTSGSLAISSIVGAFIEGETISFLNSSDVDTGQNATVGTVYYDDHLHLKIEGDSGPAVISAESSDRIYSGSGRLFLAVSVEQSTGRVIFVQNGKVCPMPSNGAFGTELFDFDGAVNNVMASASGGIKAAGKLGRMLLTNEFLDLETDAGLSKLYAANGHFCDWGTAGASLGLDHTPLVLIQGDAAAINGGSGNTGQGGAFTVVGAVTDAGGSGGGDTTSPVLTSPTAAASGTTTATAGVTTDEANGTIYAILTQSSTAPDGLQVKTGTDHLDASASAVATPQAVSSAGAKTFSFSGLTAEETYWAHFVHEDDAGNLSDVVSSASFTTEAEAGGGTYTPETITFSTGDYIAGLGLTAGTSFIAATRVTIPPATNGTVAGYVSIISDTSANTCLYLSASGGEFSIFYRPELSTGSAASLTYPVTKEQTYSILARSILRDASTADHQLWVDGVLVASATSPVADPAIRTIKSPDDIHSMDGASADQNDLVLTGGLWVANTGYDSLSYSDFFDGSNQPTFNSATINGVTATFFQNTVAGFNAGTNLGSGADFTMIGSVS